MSQVLHRQTEAVFQKQFWPHLGRYQLSFRSTFIFHFQLAKYQIKLQHWTDYDKFRRSEYFETETIFGLLPYFRRSKLIWSICYVCVSSKDNLSSFYVHPNWMLSLLENKCFVFKKSELLKRLTINVTFELQIKLQLQIINQIKRWFIDYRPIIIKELYLLLTKIFVFNLYLSRFG